MLMKHLAIVFSALSAGYLLYVKHCYKYLKSIGYDGPNPTFFLGNLASFASPDNSVSTGPDNLKPVISHYSKTLRRWTKQYGKIYGFYEGHSPVLVIADPDLVSEVFLSHSKLLTYRRSFPMSKDSTDPTADIFVSNGMRWMRVRCLLEKVMLNNKNTIRCLEYADKGFMKTFLMQNDLNKLQENFNILNRIKLFMVQTMFNVIFGIDIESFLIEMPFDSNKKSKLTQNSLYHTQIVAHRFGKAFAEYEGFSILKLGAMTISELSIIWRFLERFKRFFNMNIFVLSYFADPMDWFFDNFIKKYLKLYSDEKTPDSTLKSIEANKDFGYLNSFLYLTYNSVLKDEVIHTPNSKYRARASTVTGYKSLNYQDDSADTKFKHRNYSIIENMNRKLSLYSSRIPEKIEMTSSLNSYVSINNFINEELRDCNLDELKLWKFSIDEALSNTMLMFFAGYETTSSALGFCCHVLKKMPEQRDKLLDEIKDFWSELSFNLDSNIKKPNCSSGNEDDSSSTTEDTSFDDDVFENTEEENDINRRTKFDHTETSNNFNHKQWSEIYNTIENLKYLDMFVKEVLRMFPIANSMVSRKCMIDDLYVENGNYFIPKGINVVVDVMSIHYDPVLWGPVDPEKFYPERFLSARNPAAYLPFGIGPRKCLGVKLAISQIKLFIVRLLQNYTINEPILREKNPLIGSEKSKIRTVSSSENLSESIETKDVFFNSPINNVQVSIHKNAMDMKILE